MDQEQLLRPEWIRSELRRVCVPGERALAASWAAPVGALLIAGVTLSDNDLQRHLVKAPFSVSGTVRVDALVGLSPSVGNPKINPQT